MTPGARPLWDWDGTLARIEQIDANGAAQIGAIEANERKDQWASFKQIRETHRVADVVADHALAGKLGAGPLLVCKAAEIR